MTSVHCALRWLILAIILAAAPQARALGFRCGNHVLNTGMLSVQVTGYCGAPFWIDNYVSVEVLGAGGPVEQQREVDWEIWYYNFGSRMFMQRLTFRDGELQSTQSLGYGVDDPGNDCTPGIPSRGLTSGELVARCGVPSSRRLSNGALLRRIPGVVLASEDRREEWVYDDGGQYLVRYFISNGHVTDSEKLVK